MLRHLRIDLMLWELGSEGRVPVIKLEGPDDNPDDDPDELFVEHVEMISLKGFGNLTSLELYRLPPMNFDQVTSQFAFVLANSPGVKLPGLSVADPFMWEQRDPHSGEHEMVQELEDEDENVGFFEELCEKYGTIGRNHYLSHHCDWVMELQSRNHPQVMQTKSTIF